MSAFAFEMRRGWRNLAAATIGLGLGIPSYTTVSSMFFRTLEKQFGWSKTVAAGALIAMPITAIILPVAGWLIDRLGVRLCTCVSVLACACCYIWLAEMKGSVHEYYIAIICLNVLGCATGPIAYTRLVASQFVAARGSALAISQFGIASFSVLLPLLLAPIIQSSGARGGYLFFVSWCLVGGVAAQVLMQPQPVKQVDIVTSGVSVRAALSDSSFWMLGAAILAISVGSHGLLTQFQSVLVDRGIRIESTAWLLSLLAISVMTSRLLVGWMLDRHNPSLTAAGVLAIAAVGAAVLAISHTYEGIAIGLVMLGFSFGAELDIMSFFCARLFGLRSYARIYGVLSIFLYCGIAVGGIGYGKSRDYTGAYSMAISVTCVLLLLAAALFVLLNGHRRAASVLLNINPRISR